MIRRLSEPLNRKLDLIVAEAHAAMGYYFDHQDEIDGEIRVEWEQAERARSSSLQSPFFLRMRAKGLL